MSGKLYIVPTPVGNLEDMTMRAIRILKEADYILAEDTRTSGVLLKHFEISTPMQSHHKFNEHESVEKVADRIEAGQTFALISDAGTPGISDPGFMLSRECRRRGIVVECLPGATAFVPALLDSGLPCDRFVFEGFLPPKKGRATRSSFLKMLAQLLSMSPPNALNGPCDSSLKQWDRTDRLLSAERYLNCMRRHTEQHSAN